MSANANAIALYARKTAGFDTRVAHALGLLHRAATGHRGRAVQATSLGAEDMVITDLIARHRLPVAIGTLETGMLHAPTVALIRRIETHYALDVQVYQPAVESVVRFVGNHGERAMYDSIALRKGCCAIRKLEPLPDQQPHQRRTAGAGGGMKHGTGNRHRRRSGLGRPDHDARRKPSRAGRCGAVRCPDRPGASW